MWIYIAHTRGTSNALNTLILVEEKCLAGESYNVCIYSTYQ